jgi:7,8-dihydropterin-6-yl-methyl-4-(beta-D-ribofuranosyl)aminobenzene 5'-phosphate synthase
MKKSLPLAGLPLLLWLSTLNALEPRSNDHNSDAEAVHVTIIYDNYQNDQNLKPDWGFACLVEYQGSKLLFDAGRDPQLYKENVTRLDIDPGKIPALFISHEHGDHTAGVPWIIVTNPTIQCYFPTPYANQLKSGGALPKNSQVVAKAQHLFGPFYSTGDSFETYIEQGLVVKTEKGGVLITGCGHPGPVAMVSKAQKELGIPIYAVVGGLHLIQTPGKKVMQIADELKKLGIEQICPTHCTGDASIALLKEAFGKDYIAGGTGKEIIIQ